MKRAPRSLQHHVLYRKYNGQDSEISALLGKCGVDIPRLVPVAGTGSIAGEPSLDPLSVPRERHGGDPTGDWRRERWAQRYNKQWAAIIHAWAGLLTRSGDGETKAFGLEDGAGVDAVFRLNEVTGWSRPSHHHRYFDRKK